MEKTKQYTFLYLLGYIKTYFLSLNWIIIIIIIIIIISKYLYFTFLSSR
jgi:hypothetical protein